MKSYICITSRSGLRRQKSSDQLRAAFEILPFASWKHRRGPMWSLWWFVICGILAWQSSNIRHGWWEARQTICADTTIEDNVIAVRSMQNGWERLQDNRGSVREDKYFIEAHLYDSQEKLWARFLQSGCSIGWLKTRDSSGVLVPCHAGRVWWQSLQLPSSMAMHSGATVLTSKVSNSRLDAWTAVGDVPPLVPTWAQRGQADGGYLWAWMITQLPYYLNRIE